MIKPLTTLLFAFMIFVHHMTFFGKSKSSTLRWIHESILKEGYIGVSFFFILSGFILAYNYRDSMLNQRYQNLIFISPELPESTASFIDFTNCCTLNDSKC
jgi:hypothetical protein